ncbi:MAG: isoleucine--tRNA ligase [Microbacteriaceae bacterium]
MSYPKPSASAENENQALQASPNLPKIEEEVLEYWKISDTFKKSIANRQDCEEWVFYDGPPFANGLPHFGHLLTGYAKDLFPRFQTMRGKRVERRFGWDTHGLPAELEAMKQLGITEKSEIESMGIDSFNAVAKESVLEYTGEWQEYVTRQARWVDFENDYKTLDITFMESVIWAFKQLHEKGLAYEGYRVLPYCWRDETPLSNHELRMDDDVYKMRQDQTVTVTFPLIGEKAVELGIAGIEALAWTTTPWTLPTNLALAIGPAIQYVTLPAGPSAEATIQGRSFLLAKDLIGNYAKDLGYEDVPAALAAVQNSLSGTELSGVRYTPIFDYYTDAEQYGTESAWQILVDDFVSTEDGTGIVHMSPAYGEDDKRICDAANIPTLISVDDGAKFLKVVHDVAGLQVFDANKPLIKLLRERGKLVQTKSYEHSYPHCWRCRNPLIYKAVSSWFIRVTEIRDRMVELNEEINWVPENVKHGQFGKWIENARDWSISRNRYWGSPIPVWKSDNPDYPRLDVYGSLDELEADFGVRPDDLHRPFIDNLTRPNPDDPSGKSTMRRVEDVLDVWFDSGSMPFAQVHYPFDNRDWFESHNPADFIVEYIGQTRGWFYTMHILSTALFDRPAFKNVISHGIVLGNDGQKASKSLRNYPDVFDTFNSSGSDAIRWFLMSSTVLRGGNLIVSDEGIREGVRQFILPLWNSWYFFSLYANAVNGAGNEGYTAKRSTTSEDLLDRYILSKTGQLIRELTIDLESLDSTSAAIKLRDFVEILTNWYVRRNRERFWEGSDTQAFDTLYTVLETVARLAAPFIPLISERIWQGLTGGESVHLEDWPNADEFTIDEALVSRMDQLRALVSTGLGLRKQSGLRVRLPLASASIVVRGAEQFSAAELAILQDELNVKLVESREYSEDLVVSYGISQKLTVNARAAGPRLGKQVQQIIQAAKAGDWSESNGLVIAGGVELQEGEYELQLETSGVPEGKALALLNSESFLLLDTVLTADLEAEGLARDMIRAIQDTRKQAGFEVSDRIRLEMQMNDSDAAAIEKFSGMIQAETLALILKVNNEDESGHEFESLIAANRYANNGAVNIRVSRQEGEIAN